MEKQGYGYVISFQGMITYHSQYGSPCNLGLPELSTAQAQLVF